ncbi:MAG TPA: hypothetical protein VF183_12125 [Acidimicrobiales bacterium]
MGAFGRLVAVAAGPANWSHQPRPSSADLAVGSLQGAAFGGIVTIAVITSMRDGSGLLGFRHGLVAGLVGAVCVVVAPTVWWLLGRRTHTRPRRLDARIVAALRAVSFGAVVALWAELVGGVRPHESWLFGIVIGCEYALVARSIGTRPHPWRWWRRYLLSPWHVCVAVGSAAVGLALTNDPVPFALSLYLTIQGVVFAAVVECSVIDGIGNRFRDELRQHARMVERRKHREHAHWLHDDVCGELRLVRMKLETSDPSPQEIAAQLDELDHRLRVRQLDELLQSGTVRIAEILQPFVRRAQAHGVRVSEMPRLEQASVEVDEPVGRAVQRAAAVLISNAAEAGATEIAIRVNAAPDEGRIELCIDDDAGGFDIRDVPAGRGLDSLRHELGEHALELRRTARGTSARVVFALREHEEVS